MKVARTSLPLLACTWACSPAPSPEPPPAPAPTSAQASAATAAPATASANTSPKPLSSVVVRQDPLPPLIAELQKRAVDAEHIGRRVLVSWTNRTQADAIAAGGPVLMFETSKAYGPAAFDFMIEDEATRGNALAKLIHRTGFAKKRFAWPSAYATAAGFGGTRYGNVLMVLELKSDALLLDFSTQKVFDVDNKELPSAELVKAPERLAAVYWSTTGFREYVLLNEAAIAKVSFGESEASKLLATEVALLDALTKAFGQVLIGDEAPALEAFKKTLAFNPIATRENVTAAANTMREIKLDRLAFSGAPNRKFAHGTLRARLPRAACQLQGSGGGKPRHFDRSYGWGQYCVPSDRCQLVAGKCEVLKRALSHTEHVN